MHRFSQLRMALKPCAQNFLLGHASGEALSYTLRIGFGENPGDRMAVETIYTPLKMEPSGALRRGKRETCDSFD